MTPSPRYFAASNSCEGFRNYYGEIFSDSRLHRLYIIKGGPGTGKSHFMKVVARHAREYGYAVTEYACSSDPASLDGILIHKPATDRDPPAMIGFLDGTAPHVREPVLPGVKEEILNLGEFWNSRLLAGQSETVRALTESKSAAYRRAYAYLNACGGVDRVADSLMDGCVHTERLTALTGRLLRRQPTGQGTVIPALRRAVGMTGEVCLHTFEQETARRGGSLLILEDYYGLGYRLTQTMLRHSQRAGHDLLVSYDPVYPHKIDGLYYPATSLCVLVGRAEPVEDCAVRTISLRRYANPEALRTVRGELRHACSLREKLTDSALRELETVSSCHFELERIYSEAMDFERKERYTEQFCKELFEP